MRVLKHMSMLMLHCCRIVGLQGNTQEVKANVHDLNGQVGTSETTPVECILQSLYGKF